MRTCTYINRKHISTRLNGRRSSYAVLYIYMYPLFFVSALKGIQAAYINHRLQVVKRISGVECLPECDRNACGGTRAQHQSTVSAARHCSIYCQLKPLTADYVLFQFTARNHKLQLAALLTQR